MCKPIFMLSSVEAVLRLHLSWGCDNFLLPAPQNDLTKPGIVKKKKKYGASSPRVPEPRSGKSIIPPKLKN